MGYPTSSRNVAFCIMSSGAFAIKPRIFGFPDDISEKKIKIVPLWSNLCSQKIPVVDIIELMLLPGTPQVSKETDSYMQSTHGMSAHNGHSFTPCKAKIVLEKISCHFSISDSIGMNLFFGSHVRLLTKFSTISSPCFKPDGLFQMDVALKIELFLICSLLSLE